MTPPPDAEWLEADGLGGFASGTVGGPRTRRYHALLLAAAADGSRFVLVNGAEVAVETDAGRWALSPQSFLGARSDDGARWLERFDREPWPRWRHALPDGTRIELELVARHGRSQVLLAWRLLETTGGRVVLRVRPFLSGRDYHALHHENPAFAFTPERRRDRLIFRPYPGVPAVTIASNGQYRHEPHWYRRFHYAEEQARGLDAEEDLAVPGELEFDLARGSALLLLAAGEGETAPPLESLPAGVLAAGLRRSERERRARFPTALERAGDAYLIERAGDGKTIIAGYPWFTDWGRDTFIALRGLCLATGRLEEAGEILDRWARAVSGGMLPNRFPDGGAPPEYNSVDAALWYVVAVFEYLEATAAAARPPDRTRATRLHEAVEAILVGHAAGTRHQIRVDGDGLLAAGEPGVQLTWMDAKIGDWVVTPRVGKPVEIQALWLNALAIGHHLATPSAARWRELLERGRASFAQRFWSPEGGGRLHDVVDVDHRAGEVDATFRPNQILTVGGLPLSVLQGQRARAVVDAVERELLTPLGLRSLAPSDPGYRPRYEGPIPARDALYHQGTVWPWLLGPFVEAWVRVRGDGAEVRREARARFLPPLRAHLEEAGLGHVSEVADGAAPHRPGGCPFQAWSVAELLRLELVVLGARAASRPRLAPAA